MNPNVDPDPSDTLLLEAMEHAAAARDLLSTILGRAQLSITDPRVGAYESMNKALKFMFLRTQQ